MTRDKARQALWLELCIYRGMPQGDALADLFALAYPDAPIDERVGFGDSLDTIRPQLESILIALDYLARSNLPFCVRNREAAQAIRHMMEAAQ